MKRTVQPGEHRKPYQRDQSRWWWTKNAYFLRYMLREGTSVLVLLYSLLLVLALARLSQGEIAWQQWLDLTNHPVVIACNLLALVAALYHASTWFKLAPKIMVLRLGDWKVPESWMLIGQWLGLAVTSIAILTLALTMGG